MRASVLILTAGLSSAAFLPLAAQKPIAGRAVDAAGRPVPGVRIRFHGFSRAGERTSVDARTDAAGRFRLANLAPGRYSVRSAIRDFDYDGERYRLPLYLVGENNDDIGTDTGATVNLVWKISGKTAAQHAASDETRHFGGFLVLDARREVGGDFLPSDPTKSIVLRLVPEGRLMDGTAGRPITVTKPLSGRRPDRVVADVPLGVYRATAVLKGADGRETPMLLAPREMRSSAQRDEPAAEARIRFAPRDGEVTLMSVGGTEGVDLQLIASPAPVAAAPALPVRKGDLPAAAPAEAARPVPAAAPAPAPVARQEKFAVGQRVMVQGTVSESPGVVVGRLPGSASRWEVIFNDYAVWEVEERSMRPAGDDVAPPPAPPATYAVGEAVEWRRRVDQWDRVTIAEADVPVPGLYTIRFADGTTVRRVQLVNLRPAR